MTELPRGTVTFLFTDIEGSAALREPVHQAKVVSFEHHFIRIREGVIAHVSVVI